MQTWSISFSMLGPQTPYPSVSFQFYNSESIKTIHLSSSLQPSQPRGKENESFFFNSSRSKVQLSFLNLITACFYFLSHFFFSFDGSPCGNMPLALKVQNFSHWTTREVPPILFLCPFLFLFSFLHSGLICSLISPLCIPWVAFPPLTALQIARWTKLLRQVSQVYWVI